MNTAHAGAHCNAPLLIDTHCHLDFPQFDGDREEVIKRAKITGVDYIVNIGSSIEGSRKSLDLASKYEFIYCSLGIHPHEADGAGKEAAVLIKGAADNSNNKVVAIGEIGLDYFKNYSSPHNQRQLFISLLKLAKEINKPVVLHSRQAEADTLAILKDFKPLPCVVHCFSGDENFLRICLDLGFFVSFTCNITYKKAQNLRDVLKNAPLKRIMLETDSPYLSPEGLRGRRNEPCNVKYAALELAKIKGITFEESVKVTTDNARGFFKI